MRKINETYEHEETGMHFDIEYVEQNVKDASSYVLLQLGENAPKELVKKVRIIPNKQAGWVSGEKGFVFNRSKPETIKKIGKALLEIGEFVEKL